MNGEKHPPKIFIGSASVDINLAKKVAKILVEFKVDPKLWTDTDAFVPGKTIYKNLIDISKEVDGAIFIFGNSDELVIKDKAGKDVFVPRDNVLIEYGIFSSLLHFTRVHIIRFEGTKIASDLYGITYTDYETDSKLRIKIENWLNKNILISKFRTPYQEYLFALNEIAYLRQKLKYSNNDLIKKANKLEIDYKSSTIVEKDFWKIAFMPEHFIELVNKIINVHTEENLINIFSKCGIDNYNAYLKYEHLPYNRRIENTITKMVMDIMEKRISEDTFHQLFDSLDKNIYSYLHTTIFNLSYYWDDEKDKLYLFRYKNEGG